MTTGHSIGLPAAHAGVRLSNGLSAAADERRYHVRLLDNENDFTRIAQDWVELEKRARGVFFFQSHAWCRHILDTLGGVEAGQARRPVIAAAWQKNRLVAVWPLSVKREAGARVLTALGAPYDQYSEIIVDGEAEAEEIVALMVGALSAAGIADGMLLRKVRLNEATYSLAGFSACLVDDGERAPQVHLDPQRPFSDFLAGISAKTRKNLRNYRNRLQKLGRVEHRLLRGTAAGPAMMQAYEGRRAWLASHGMSSEAFRDQQFEDVIQSLARTEAVELGLVAFELTLDGKPISLQWGFLQGRRYYAFMSSRDPAFEEYSVGRLHLQDVLEACHGLGVTQADLMVPEVPYKMTWTQSSDPLVDIVMPWSIRGRLTFGLYHGRVRPLLKQAARRLPVSVRRRVFSHINVRAR